MASVSGVSSVTCDQHEDEEVRFYCEHCKKMICDDCIIGGHKNHKTVKLKEFGAQKREAISMAIIKAEQEKLPQIETCIKQANEGKKTFTKLTKKEMEIIESKRKHLDAILDELQNELSEGMKDAEIKAEHQYDRFIKVQELKKHKIKEIIDDIKSKGTNITDMDVAKFDVLLEDLLVHDSYADTVPHLQPPRYQFNEEFAKKEKLQHFMGYIESDLYAAVGEDDDVAIISNTSISPTYLEPVSRNAIQYTQLVSLPKKGFNTISSFDIPNSVSIIVPKEVNRTAWLLDKHITEVDCTHGNKVFPKLLKTLDQTVISACMNKNNELIMAFPNKNSLKQLQTAVNKFTKNKSYSLVASFTVGSNKTSKLFCICSSPISPEEHIVCLQDKNTNEKYTIQWYKNGKAYGAELSTDTHNIEMELPIQISQNNEGHICIVCRPKTKSSWIEVIDKDGKQLLRYPAEKESDGEKFDFVGAGFLKDINCITIADRANCEQILLSLDGQCIQRDKLDTKPVCCTVDSFDNVWLGFEEGKVVVKNYRKENEYAEVTAPTHF